MVIHCQDRGRVARGSTCQPIRHEAMSTMSISHCLSMRVAQLRKSAGYNSMAASTHARAHPQHVPYAQLYFVQHTPWMSRLRHFRTVICLYPTSGECYCPLISCLCTQYRNQDATPFTHCRISLCVHHFSQSPSTSPPHSHTFPGRQKPKSQVLLSKQHCSPPDRMASALTLHIPHHRPRGRIPHHNLLFNPRATTANRHYTRRYHSHVRLFEKRGPTDRRELHIASCRDQPRKIPDRMHTPVRHRTRGRCRYTHHALAHSARLWGSESKGCGICTGGFCCVRDTESDHHAFGFAPSAVTPTKSSTCLHRHRLAQPIWNYSDTAVSSTRPSRPESGLYTRFIIHGGRYSASPQLVRYLACGKSKSGHM